MEDMTASLRVLISVSPCGNIRVTTAFSLSRAENYAMTRENICSKTGTKILPLGEEESAEVELLPPKIEDIVVVVIPFYPF
jgi:hypothetical protein